MTEYNYTLSGDFGATGTDITGFLYTNQFHNEITNSSISQNLSSIDIDEGADSVTVTFDSSLDSSDQAELNTIISLHIPDYSIPRKNFFNVATDALKSNLELWATMASFEYKGSTEFGVINYIDVISKIQMGDSTYDVRVVNSTTADVLCIQTDLSNTKSETIDLGTVSNIPTDSAILEVQVKRNGVESKNVYLHQVTIYYNN